MDVRQNEQDCQDVASEWGRRRRRRQAEMGDGNLYLMRAMCQGKMK